MKVSPKLATSKSLQDSNDVGPGRIDRQAGNGFIETHFYRTNCMA